MSLTEQGFKRPTFVQIRSEIAQGIRDIYGPVNTGPESAIGQQISIMAERENKLWEAQEAVYLSQYPDSAKGRSLDGAVQLTRITRRGATRSEATVTLSGDAGVVIPKGSQVSTEGGHVFETVEPATLDSDVQVIALEVGPVPVLAGTITEIETPVPGWDGVVNAQDGTTGRSVETDPELRLRRLESLSIAGAATEEAIRARLLQQVEGVTAVSIISNRTMEVDADGRPPKSFETVVQGGADKDIAELIWIVQPAGIEPYGQQTETVTDSQGKPQEIGFSRPIPRYVWVKVTLSPDEGGTLPVDVVDIATQTIVDKGDTLAVGDDVLFQSFYGPLYREIPGLGLASVQIGISEDADTEPAYTAENKDIAANELALFFADRVTVEVV